MFIIPQNYTFKNKLFGFIPYSSLIINLIIFIVIYFIVNLFVLNINLKIFILISFCFPILLFSIFGINNEPLIYVLFYLLKYLLSSKLYLFKKY